MNCLEESILPVDVLVGATHLYCYTEQTDQGTWIAYQ